MITNRTLLFVIGTILLYDLWSSSPQRATAEYEVDLWLVGTIIFLVATLLNLFADYQKWRLFSRARRMRRERGRKPSKTGEPPGSP